MAEQPTSKSVSPTSGTASSNPANQDTPPNAGVGEGRAAGGGGAGGGSGGGDEQRGNTHGTPGISIDGIEGNNNNTIIINNGGKSEVTTKSPDSKQVDKAQSNGKNGDKLIPLLTRLVSKVLCRWVRTNIEVKIGGGLSVLIGVPFTDYVISFDFDFSSVAQGFISLAEWLW